MSYCKIDQAFKYVYTDKIVEFPDPINKTIHELNDYSRVLLKSTLVNSSLDLITKKFSQLDSILEKELSAYKSVKGYLKDISDSESLQQLKHYLLDFTNFNMKDEKNKLLTLYKKYTQERMTIDDTMVHELKHKIKNNYNNKQDIIKLNQIFAQSGFFSLLKNETLPLIDEIIDGKNPLDLIEKITINELLIKLGKNYGEYYITGILKNTSLINQFNYSGLSKEDVLKIQQVATLHALSKIDNINAFLKDLVHNKSSLYNELITASKSLETMHNKLFKETKDNIYSDMNLINDVYADNYIKEPLTKEELKTLDTKEWQILREPTDTTLGIKVKKVDISKVEGIGTDTYYRHNHIVINSNIYKKYNKDSSIKKLFMGKTDKPLYIITLTTEEKRKLGLIEDPADTLYRSLSRYKFMLDTQQIREHLLDNQTYDLNVGNTEELIDLINKDNHPWLISLDKINYTDLPEAIKRKYKITKNKSNIAGFSDKIDLVRKDVEPWLMGYKKVKFNNKTLNKGLDILQKLVLMSKISQIIIAPKKLFLDYISNNILLMSKGISLTQILPETKKANKALLELQQLQTKLILANINLLSDPDNIKKQKEVERIKEEINKHPYNFVYYNDFVQSLASEVVLKDFDTITGLHKDIKNVINTFVKKADSEELNAFGEIVKKLMKTNKLNINEVIYKLADIGEDGFISYNIKEIANSLKRTKTEEDVVQYLSNLFYTPGSELTKTGTLFMQWTDTIPRIILYKYLRSKGKSDREAVLDAMDTFIDYRPNMPKELQFMSDTFLMPYPAFMIKVQRVIYNLFKEKPLTTTTQFILDMVNNSKFLDFATPAQMNIVGSNIFNKIEKGQIISEPTISDISPIQKVWDLI